MIRKSIGLFFQTMFLLGLVLPAGAQTQYTLKDLCRVANKNAAAIKIAGEDLYIAQQEKQRALSVLIPRATLYGSYLNYKNDEQLSPDTNSVGGS